MPPVKVAKRFGRSAKAGSNSEGQWATPDWDCGVAWSILRGSGLRDASSNLASPIRPVLFGSVSSGAGTPKSLGTDGKG